MALPSLLTAILFTAHPVFANTTSSALATTASAGSRRAPENRNGEVEKTFVSIADLISGGAIPSIQKAPAHSRGSSVHWNQFQSRFRSLWNSQVECERLNS